MRALLLIAVASCFQKPGDATYRDKQTDYSVRAQLQLVSGRGMDIMTGERGRVNPVVLEYVLAAPDGPLARYYDLALALPDKPAAMAHDLAVLEPVARGFSAKPGGAEYARALAKKLVPSVNDALASGNPIGKVTGTATIYWGEPVELDQHRLKDPYEAITGVVGRSFSARPLLATVIARYQSADVVLVGSDGTRHYQVWDVHGIPGAFDPGAALDYAKVAATIRPLHQRVPR